MRDFNARDFNRSYLENDEFIMNDEDSSEDELLLPNL